MALSISKLLFEATLNSFSCWTMTAPTDGILRLAATAS
jgi:hypothetical protein